MNLPGKVKLVEVGARDGLQNESCQLSVADRIAFIDRLSATGLPAIEVGSFVSAQNVPQMADTAAVFAGISQNRSVSYPVLVPNLRGLEMALAAGVKEVAFFAAASESFSQHNINCSIDQSLDRLAEIMNLATVNEVQVRGYVSCIAGCPYEGQVGVENVTAVAARLIELGCYEVSLGDTIGIGTPAQIKTLLSAVVQKVPVQQLAVHFHDTYGQALANILVAMEEGIAVVDSSVAGLGGCPYAPGASGNVATEDVLYMLNGLGVETGVNLEALVDAGSFICERLGRATGSKVAKAFRFAKTCTSF